jgi:alkylation response protein AidB-like acyl-CoA dehydrogenase
MQLTDNEQQHYLEQALERFLRESYSLAQRADILASSDGFSRAHWTFFAELGLLGLPFAEADGGFGGILVDAQTVMRVLGKGLVAEPYLPCVLHAGRILAHGTDAQQKEKWLAPLIAGERLTGLAHRECGDAVVATLAREGNGWRLRGDKLLVIAATSMDTLLVSARDETGALRIACVDTAAPGVAIRPYRSVDGIKAGAVHFDTFVGDADLLALADVGASLADAECYANAALCAEALGCMRALLDATVDYAKTRKQFGRPLGSFQVLKHRLVDAYALCEQAEGLVRLAGFEAHRAWTANVDAACAFIARNAVAVGHEAIQIHGGMGLTDELAVSHHHKRLVQIAALFGDRNGCTDRYLRHTAIADSCDTSNALPFSVLLSAAEQAFRDEVRGFLERELDAELVTAVRRQTISYPEKDVAVAWQQKLQRQGWLAPHWPVEHGGTGWSPIQRFIFEYECALAGAPEQIPMGFRYVGPVIAEFGSLWQREFFLPRLLSSEHYWAQGFSEPGAGSDLASLKTTAELRGDHFVVNGSKMWTTHAHFANWLFCLVRTSVEEKPQQGISFLLIDMKSPGITVKPIPLLAVDHEVNQVFLDDVRVPVDNLIGEPGRGWDYAKYLLEFERGGTVFCGRLRRELAQVKEVVDAVAPQRWQDRVFAHELAALEHRLMAVELFEFRMASAMRAGSAPGVGGSVSKLVASELQKDINELGMRAAGIAALELEPRRPLHGPEVPALPDCDLERVIMPRYLNMRVASIYGGSSEIQREIIGKQILGLR